MIDAERATVAALRDVQQHLKTVKDPLEVTRSKRVFRDLQGVLSAISRVRSVRSLYGVEDDVDPKTPPAPKTPPVGPETPPTT